MNSRMAWRALAAIFAVALSFQSLANDGSSPDAQEILKAASGGDAKAQLTLDAMYDEGRGAPHDRKEAMKWYRASAAQGHARATSNLAYLYDLGLGVPQDRRRGFELYSKAADMGWAEAMWNIANMYGAGQLGKEDLLMACVWTVRARRFASPSQQQLLAYAARVMLKLEKALSPEALASCKDQGEDWTPPNKAG
jgi:uncharacterized protein